jgi:hypothetical protein
MPDLVAFREVLLQPRVQPAVGIAQEADAFHRGEDGLSWEHHALSHPHNSVAGRGSGFCPERYDLSEWIRWMGGFFGLLGMD